MTDETQTPEEQPEQPEERITLFDVWSTFYERALLQISGLNGVNKADKQQYRIKAAQTADVLTQLEVRIRG